MSPCLKVPEVGISVPFINFLFSNFTGPLVLSVTSESILFTPIPSFPCTVTRILLPSGLPNSMFPLALTTRRVLSSVISFKSSEDHVPIFTALGSVSIINGQFNKC